MADEPPAQPLSELDAARLAPWIAVAFSRSPGPGGQNVNKLNTRVTLLFDFANCPFLTATQRQLVRSRLATRLSRDGRLRVVCHRERSQAANRAAAEQRLLDLLITATHRRRTRKPTQPTGASRERRLRDKRSHGQKKSQRQGPLLDE